MATEQITSWQPPADSGISIKFVEAGGNRYEVAMAGAGDRLALCLHGFPELHYSWRHQMPMLAEMGYRVWAPNMRGYGESHRPVGTEHYGLNRLAQDVADVIDASGAKDVTLIAHDWGAIVAWHFAIKKLRPLTKLIILNVPHPKCGQREIKKWRQLKKSWYIFFFQIPWLPEKLLARGKGRAIQMAFRGNAVNTELFDDQALEPYRQAALRPGALTAMLSYYRALLQIPDGRDLPTYQVDIPTLVLWGEQDIALDIHLLDGLEDYVPDLTIKRFPEASHWVQQDVPDAVNAELQSWLEG
ncbi:alpha/beta fold hydrolase [Altererythrobacter sp. RZ02]|uniref:Alpha/beta fold hydrolase n=1 Tax=Pontixanthobacter rizhaonensis TaxID=2730337 RepID=A0A848QLC7_9SPHN|nr:alpha/beta fold hydrolase [Pontixanthobacter rizhaonensis]NMW31619.1 alpha/beta fold hydrolase [Pontixanthobacter rizhaonensis]